MRFREMVEICKRNNALFFSLKLVLICYLATFSLSYLSSETSANFSNQSRVHGMLTAGEWEVSDESETDLPCSDEDGEAKENGKQDSPTTEMETVCVEENPSEEDPDTSQEDDKATEQEEDVSKEIENTTPKVDTEKSDDPVSSLDAEKEEKKAGPAPGKKPDEKDSVVPETPVVTPEPKKETPKESPVQSNVNTKKVEDDTNGNEETNEMDK